MTDESDRNFGLIRPFNVDDGELDGLTHAECFTLGYELALFDERLKTGERFEMLAHAANKHRIEAEAAKQCRLMASAFLPDDRSESWIELAVEKSDAS